MLWGSLFWGLGSRCGCVIGLLSSAKLSCPGGSRNRLYWASEEALLRNYGQAIKEANDRYKSKPMKAMKAMQAMKGKKH